MKIKKYIKENNLKKEFIHLFKNKYFYLGSVLFILSSIANTFAQKYLNNMNENIIELPRLSDLILDNIPYYNISFIYDWISFLSIFLFVIYIIQKKKFKELPYYLIVFSIFYFLRAIFVILTPLGNPPKFNGSNSVFNGFAKHDIGAYPSGHTGGGFIYILITNGIYRFIYIILIILIMAALFLSRGHYSIDLLSAILFSYAVYKFSEKYIRNKVVKK